MSRLERTLKALDPLVLILTLNERQRVRISSGFRNTLSGGLRGTRLDQVPSLRLRSHFSFEVTHSNEDTNLAGKRYHCFQTHRGGFLPSTATTQTEKKILTNWCHFQLNTFRADCLLRIDIVHCQF